MFDELTQAELTQVEPLFSLPHLNLVIRAVVRGHSPARVWGDTSSAPQTALMWDGRHCIFLTGDAEQATHTGLLRRFLADIATEATSANVHLFKVFLSDASWGAAVEDILPAMRRRDRILLRLHPTDAPKQVICPDGFQVDPIDQALIEAVGLRNLDLVLEEISGGWLSVEHFLKHGFGFVVRHDDTLVSWCTAEYVSERMCGIGIETVPEFRARGLATLLATAFTTESLARGIVAHWDSWLDNYPSLRVAEKVGFQPLSGYQVYFGQNIRPEA